MSASSRQPRAEGQASGRRCPAVAGSFYPDDPDDLRRLVTRCCEESSARPRPCLAVIVPHAGLVYSGACAGAVFGRVVIPPVAVIVAPNHHGLGRAPAALWTQGEFDTPLGPCAIDAPMANAIATRCVFARHDPAAHALEHAIEVELPFLRVLAPATRIVPMLVSFDDWRTCEQLATAIADAASIPADVPLLIASSDMTHYERADVAMARDEAALAAIERLDGRELLEVCQRDDVTMCGRAAAAVVVDAARRLGATRGEVVDHRHSGMVSGDHATVVSYAGVIVD